MHRDQIEPDFSADDTIGGRISLARDAIDLTVDEAADFITVSSDTWTSWENDRAEPLANRLPLIARLLEVSLSWLLTGRGDGPRWA
ncbi:transcriptional regulator with XRE-family HTH domain [Neorhizobium huautlense]|uniref:Transcriptional regulator with XRE-family HTH domain n=1 Tax=Neorhizobium huautlense TaxID=67774 RepID=A0ABT9PNZ3_9HYPH|nr:helix-turn-helix transcriptional regulator [Neorhizobium huautlense]MDP9835419.1 transcriptional regulator with XRE-family HTH domain [Neorhizobium huautlense]